MLRILRVFRCIRALRSLRFLSSNMTVRIVLSTLLNSASPISITTMLAFTVICIIANLGQSLFSGALWRCSDVWVETEALCVGVGSQGVERSWNRNAMHFDWIGHALLSVFAVATNEGWVSLMHVAMDSGDASAAVVQDVNATAAAYFAIGVLLANLICLNMFRGVFIDVFTRSANIIERGYAAMHPPRKPHRDQLPHIWDLPIAQESLLNWSARLMGCPCSLYIPPRHRENRFRANVFAIVDHTFIEFTSAVGLLCSMVLFSLAGFKPARWQSDIDEIATGLFASILGAEVIFKMFAMHPARFFDSGWDSLDLLVLLATSLLIALRNTSGMDVSILKFLALHPLVFRSLRLVKLLQSKRLAKLSRTILEMQQIVVGMFQSRYMFSSLIALLLILCFIFSVAGIQVVCKKERHVNGGKKSESVCAAVYSRIL